MKKHMQFLTMAAVVGVALLAGISGSTANAHDGPYPGRYRGYGSHAGYGYGGRGYYAAPVARNQIFFSTPGFSIGIGSPAPRYYRARPVYVPVHPQPYYHPGCGW